MWEITLDQWAQYLQDALGGPVIVHRAGGLCGGPNEGKGHGYGKPLLLEYTYCGKEHRAVVETTRPGANGHEHRADRAQQAIWAFDAFGKLPTHVIAIDVGAFRTGDVPLSLGKTTEFFYVSAFSEGHEYAHDFPRLMSQEHPEPDSLDLARTEALARWAADVHSTPLPETVGNAEGLWRRRVRELVGHGECLMGVIDTYPTDAPGLPAGLLQRLEHLAVDWRWRLRPHADRLRLVHGDLHPWNILFEPGSTKFTVLDRSRGEFGEPADDVTCLTLNYAFFSLQGAGRLAGPLAVLHDRFWSLWLQGTQDKGALSVAPPFAAFRALVMANPLWYPQLAPTVRGQLFHFANGVMELDEYPWFDLNRLFGCE